MTVRTITIPLPETSVEQTGFLIEALGDAALAISTVAQRPQCDFPAADILVQVAEDIEEIREGLVSSLRERPLKGEPARERMNILLRHMLEANGAYADDVAEVLALSNEEAD